MPPATSDLTWFRLAVRGIGVFLIAWAVPITFQSVREAYGDWHNYRFYGLTPGFPWWLFLTPLGALLQLGIGIYLLMGAWGLIRYCCRGAMGMCPACNYDVRNVPGSTCPECGVALPGRSPAPPSST